MSKLLNMATVLDLTPVSPAWWGERAGSLFYERRRTRAAADAEWSSIEARRHCNEAGMSVFLSDDLTMEDWDRQLDISYRITPVGPVEYVGRLLAGARFSQVARVVVYAGQRVTRGWDDTTLWDLGHSTCRTLGEQLAEMAAAVHSWPGNGEFPQFEDWQNALAVNGAKLSRYAQDETEDEAIALEAREALVWVAEHLGHLWD